MSKRLRKRKKMFDHIRRWHTSGLSQRTYCEKHRINRAQFYYWIKIQQSQDLDVEQPTQFLPVVIKESEGVGSDERIVLRCPNGMVVTFPHEERSVSLIRQLLMG